MNAARNEPSVLEARLSEQRAERMRRRMRVITIIGLAYWVLVFVFADHSLHAGQSARFWLRGAQCASCVVFLWWLRRPHSLRATELMGVGIGVFGALLSSIGSIEAPAEKRGPIVVSVLLAVAVEAPVVGLSWRATASWFGLTIGMLVTAILAGPSAGRDTHLLWIGVTSLAYGVLILHAASRDRLERAEYFARAELHAANQRLAEHEETRSRLFMNLSHDFRTPLALIRGEAELLLRDGDARGVTSLGRIVSSVAAMSDLTEQLLELARLDLGQVPHHPAVFDVAPLARELAALHQPPTAAISVTTSAPDEPLLVRADPGHTRRILGNLVANAVRATSRQGSFVQLRTRREGASVVVEVVDDGPGIPPERRARVFERFASFEAQGSTVSGIGLALARELTQVNGGALSLLDTEGGTTFRLVLSASDGPVDAIAVPPRDVPAAVAVPGAPAVESVGHALLPGARPRLLVVEDNGEMRDLLSRTLSPAFDVILAPDVATASRSLASERLDAVLCDVLLPDGNGYDVVRAIRARPSHDRLAVVLLSALGDAEERSRGISLGADDYLGKPFAPLELTTRVSAAIERHAERERALQRQREAFLMEVHDGVSASLVRAALLLEAHRRETSEAPGTSQVDDALGAVREGLTEARGLLALAAPETPRLFEEVVGDVRHELSSAVEAADLDFSFESETDGSCSRVSAPADHALRRIAREAVTNVVKHAGARRVSCNVQARSGSLFIRIEDDGAGMKKASDGGFGLANIEKRAASLRGRARYGTSSSGGSFVEAWIEA
jgi:signal transduction histidine kinase